MSRVETLYQKLCCVECEPLEQGRELELEGKVEDALREYSSALNTLEEGLVLEDEEYDDFECWRDEALAKLYLARGKKEELNGGNPSKEYLRALEQLKSLESRLSQRKRSADQVSKARVENALQELEVMLSGKSEEKDSGADKYSWIAAHMPPLISDKLKPYEAGCFDMHYTGSLEDLAVAETKDYYVVVAKWEGHEWSDIGGGIAWKEWLSVYFCKKGGEELKTFSTETIKTRDNSDPRKDKSHLWKYDYAGVEVLEGNKVRVYWKAEDGEEGPSYVCDLDAEFEISD